MSAPANLSAVKLIELAMIKLLAALPRTQKLAACESYAGNLDDQAWTWIRAVPAVWVKFVGAERKRSGPRKMLVDGTFMVACACRNLATQPSARLGDAAEVGVYDLLEENQQALWNSTLGLPVQPLTPGKTQQMLDGIAPNGEPMAVYAQEFTVQWMELQPEPGAVPAGELRSVYLNYFLKPGDALVDASDVVTTVAPVAP